MIFDTFVNILKSKSIDDLSVELNISKGTIKRWLYLKKIPKSYTFQIMKICDIKIDYSKFSFKDKDQFFTPVPIAVQCYRKSIEIIKNYGDDDNDYIFIEPSAGSGNFVACLPPSRRICMDIEPTGQEILEQDYLNWVPAASAATAAAANKYIVIGNPPFGLRGQLALKFINHSNQFADYVCFILPQLFESDGKGVPRKRVIGFNLIYSEKLETHFEEPNGKQIKVQCIFQVWSKFHHNADYDIATRDETTMKIYSLSDGNSPSTIRNKNMFNKCDIYIPASCFGEKNMRYYNNFTELPGRKGYGVVFNKDKLKNISKFKSIEWNKVSFLSTNSAYNIRMSHIHNLFWTTERQHP
jgi:hypothetical protein